MRFDDHRVVIRETTRRGAADALTAQSLVRCVLFAVARPSDCFITSFHFEQV